MFKKLLQLIKTNIYILETIFFPLITTITTTTTKIKA
jgi:hypothetical protein